MRSSSEYTKDNKKLFNMTHERKTEHFANQKKFISQTQFALK